MKRRRSQRQKLSVSLFPFLAVLICTLGVLIVLLVLAVKSAEVQATNDHQAKQVEVDQQTATLTQLRGELDDIETKIELISSNRPDGLADMSRSREYRGHLESEIRKLKERIDALDEALSQTESNEPAELDLEETKDQIELLTQKVLLAEKELSNKRKEVQGNARVTYSIVPHAGNGGTYRRPIFIEARGDSITIQPLGIKLQSDDFLPPLGPGNPLDAAVLAIREYWQNHQVGSSDESPYPLIVIRPDGAEGYAIARRSLISWEDEFGYELVDAEKELDFGKVDEELKGVVEAAINESRVRQQKMLAARRSQQAGLVQQAGFRTGGGSYSRGSTRKSDQRPGLTVSGTGGGFVVNSGWEERFHQSDILGGSSNPGTAGSSGSSESNLGRFNEGTGSIQGESEFGGTISSTGSQSALNQGNQNLSGQTDQYFTSAGNSSINGDPAVAHNSEVGQSGSGQPVNGETGQGGPSNLAGNGESGAPGSGGQQGESCESCSAAPLMYQHMSLAKSKGRDWAVPNKPAGSTAYVRPIRIVCTQSELEVMSPVGVEKRIPIGERVEDAIDPLVNEIWRQIESWGIPGERSHWKPELKITVVAGGELNFERLQGLLFESGIQVKESTR